MIKQIRIFFGIIVILVSINMAQTKVQKGIDLLESNFKNNLISKHDYILNKFYFIFDKTKLESKYFSGEDKPLKCATPLIIDFQQNKNLFSSDELNLIDRYLSVEKYSDAPLAVFNSPGGKFALTYSTTGTHAVPAADGNSNGVPDYVEWIASYFDYVWAYEIDTLGFLPPPIGGGKYQIGFENMSGAYGYTAPTTGQLTKIVMHNTFLGFPTNTDPEGNQKGAAKVTAAHEFKHAHQIVYNNWSEPSWFIELDATWMEDQAYDATNDYYNYVNYTGSPFVTPSEALDAGDGYEDCPWMLYLTEKNGITLNKRIWQRRVTNPGEDIFTTMNYILNTYYGSNFQEAFREYSVWNFLTNSRASTNHAQYGEASAYYLTALCRTVSSYPASGSNCTISKYSNNFLRINPPANSNNLLISFNGADNPHIFKVSVVTRSTSGQVSSYQINLSAANDGSFLVPVPNNQLSYAGLCVAVVSGSTGPTFTYQITEQSGASAQVNINAGWNLISIPLNANSMDFTSLFPEAISNAYIFNNGYQTAATAELGKAYWIKFNSALNKMISGSTQSGVTINVTTGWNMIGPLNNDIPVSGITTNPSGIISSPFYSYGAGYTEATLLEKGKGYWVKVNANGTISISSK